MENFVIYILPQSKTMNNVRKKYLGWVWKNFTRHGHGHAWENPGRVSGGMEAN